MHNYPHTLESRALISKNRKGIPAWSKGLKLPQFHGENATHWKGDKVGYRGLHYWVQKVLGKPTTCEDCGRTGLTGKKIDWANISGKYLRIERDWKRLCKPCHYKFDHNK